ncbi:hypothetical protein HUZ36_08085 [Pseudoalteromonas sp. McH1-7]|uniref:Uncharacterized protein n=1 Tax=Pseudoalteromonas peptidolytica F12-50-A1 TaxID=1315280 RepID=A0A8I0T4B6_9GAMM|nr:MULTISPECIES: hypothetical protein [Pseudoalteromonas]MBE0345049.1 hypothetical protein [Pseudoalteromonas peptidolytica F12-50-A1]MDW7550359.1 hypothetical protein [Pseudoalteromonas peptidolytica]NUZ10735.1 hypothetical protein [Pseudoalteromonas sp. McH1-7]USD28172.1 hypothetical protein J8Z24_14825 [Pseudoalteromonas sp. SCSIO 43201]GEK09415.1 hypothetical protein PPE03_16640 [Pseudoalteromonas peptidolytica]
MKKAILARKNQAKTTSQVKLLSDKVILTESVLGKVSGARGGGGILIKDPRFC